MACDTSADRFGFLQDVHGELIGAGNGAGLKQALDGIYQGRIVAKAVALGEREPAPSDVEGPESR